MGHTNIEIKAKSNDHEFVRNTLLSLSADYKGVDHQIDTYFIVPHGRLKLREGNIENHLIHYERQNQEGPKEAKVTLYNSTPNSSLKSILEKALGILAVVDKKREIYFIENVKFHIDIVENLGTFVEIEAIDLEDNIGKAKLHEQCTHYMETLNIKESDLLSVSYSDLILAKTHS